MKKLLLNITIYIKYQEPVPLILVRQGRGKTSERRVRNCLLIPVRAGF